MIISHRYRFIFIKTLKTAGTSIECYLSRQCGPDDCVTPVFPEEPGHEPRNHDGFFNHMSATALQEKLPEDVWGNYFKFCVERNPWDKVLSHFAMERHRLDGDLEFERYFAARAFRPCLNWPLYANLQTREVLVDRVLPYENLNESLGDVFNQLGVPWEGALAERAKSGYRTDNRPYQEILSPRQIEIIGRLFAPECELMGYRFEGGTK